MAYPDPRPEAERLLALATAKMPQVLPSLDGHDLVTLPAVRREIDRLFDYIVQAITPAVALMVQRSDMGEITRSVASAHWLPQLTIEAPPRRITFAVLASTGFVSSPAWLEFRVEKSGDPDVQLEEMGCLAEAGDRWEWRYVDPAHRGLSTTTGVLIDQLAPLLPGRIAPYLTTTVQFCIESMRLAATKADHVRRSGAAGA